MKKILFLLLVLLSIRAGAQTFNNEWIDYSKTYYKFKIGASGLYRISPSALPSAIASTPAEQFQLWHNGTEIPLYTSLPTGTLSASDYIEFWGDMNDGTIDRTLYRNPDYLLNDKWSLTTDTAAYYLTVNPGINKRLTPTVNNVAGTTLTPEPFFMYTVGNWFRNQLSAGFSVLLGDAYMLSSSYDLAEGWVSTNIGAGGNNQVVFTGLAPYTGANAPNGQFKVAVSGYAPYQRSYKATMNGDSTKFTDLLNYYNASTDSISFSPGRITSGTATVAVTNLGTSGGDRMLAHRYEITYPRLFNFGGAKNFDFTLPPSPTPQYLQITNFTAGSATPVLYDLTNGIRLVANTATAGQYGFILPAATQAGPRRLVMVSEDPTNFKAITGFDTRNFLNITAAQNQGDYLIISNPILFAGGSSTNPVEDYRAYRSSTTGGGYTAKVYTVDELVDQFAFGVKKDPLALRNFILYARAHFAVAPKHVFLIGKGTTYVYQRLNETNPNIDLLNLVPTFGSPASDGMLAADPGSSIPMVSIGRLSAVYPAEVAVYLQKVKEYEQQEAFQSPLIADKAWMKNVVHLVGSSEPGLLATLNAYVEGYKNIITDTLFGAHVTTFSQSSPYAVEQINSGALTHLFQEGISLITYFGHSAASHLEFNLDNPSQYNNQGKYPMFVALGCNVGNVYGFNPSRLSTLETLSEQFVLAQERGTIGFLASSHFGVTDYLNAYTVPFYKNVSYKNYGKAIGDITRAATADMLADYTQENFYARATCEESNLNGDPAITLNPHAKPDYVIEDYLVRTTPSFVSIAVDSFKVRAQMLNIGKAVDKRIVVEVKRTYPAGNTDVIRRDTIPGIRYIDSISVSIPIVPNRDKGLNRITITVDADNAVDEKYETNNSVTKDVYVYEDEARTVFPYNFAIVNHQNIKFSASTANPFATSRVYNFEMDTTEFFNSSSKITASVTSSGGVLEFTPTYTYQNNTVYYWRVSQTVQTGQPSWSTSSFIFLANNEPGFNQSHVFQQFKSSYERMHLDSASRQLQFNIISNELYIRNGVFGTATGQEGDLVVNVNGQSYIRNTCNYGLIFNVFDAKSFHPWKNTPQGLYGSYPANCAPSRVYNFEFANDTAGRRKARQFLEQIPAGNYIVVRNQPRSNPLLNQYAATWANDATPLGTNLYTELKNNGFTDIDSIYKPRVFAFVYKKGGLGYVPAQGISVDKFDVMSLTTYAPTPDSLGTISSPVFGPSTSWKTLDWRVTSLDTGTADKAFVSVLGVKANGQVDTLFNNITPTQQTVDVSSMDASVYPYAKLYMVNSDSINFTPYQLDYWRLTYVPVAEGAIAPNLAFNMKDTLDVGEPIELRVAFKNISDYTFTDSLGVKAVITDRSNVAHVYNLPRIKPLHSGDTAVIHLPIDTRQLVGANNLFLEVNPNSTVPEQYHFNNFLYKDFIVRGDTLAPLMDVTFDNVHILNGDIVSAKPNIIVKLKDEAKYWMLDDTALMTVQVRFPDGSVHPYSFTNIDTLQFIPAQAGIKGNTATINFKPYFTEDGTYELIVTGNDKSGNKAGRVEYRIAFEVINKPMISNMLNYPNPFTTSTAFVFTVTGSEVPQNIRIEVLTITGKIVREITKTELGSIHIGRNITDYKWDGTDQYGQKLGNGVYLYRVVTNLNGKSLDKYQSANDHTDKYFKQGYGKMYLMR